MSADENVLRLVYVLCACLAMPSFAACDRSSGTASPSAPARASAKGGWAREPNGSVHRVEAAACNPGHEKLACSDKATEHQCRADADCSVGPQGRCVMAHLFSEPRYGGTCFCSYTCATDADCGPGRACVCEGRPYGQCADAECRSDADCILGECALSVVDRADQDDLALACRGPGSECRGDSDCKEPSRPRCVYHKSDKRWACDSGRSMY